MPVLFQTTRWLESLNSKIAVMSDLSFGSFFNVVIILE